MSEDEWIPNNIQQRRCEVFSPFSNEDMGTDDVDGGEHTCKCRRKISEHPDPRRRSDVWSMSKNTKPVPCKDFGTIQFGNEKTSKFVRLDIETPMSVVKKLLLDVWNLPEPNWIISVIGDKKDLGVQFLKKEELETNMKKVILLFSNGQNMWITCEGIHFGVSDVIGKIVDRQRGDTLLGVCGWRKSKKQTKQILESEKKCLTDNRDTNRPSELYPHHLLVDDGSANVANNIAFRAFHEFRAMLEASLCNHNDESSSLPLVILLYSGWAYIIDGIVAAVDNNIPIVVLEGTGGFADNFASVYKESKEDPNSSEQGGTWTGTVIDDRLRKKVQVMLVKVLGKEYKEGQLKILQCLQKRELITTVTLESETSLAEAIITALLKTKTIAEMLRIIDYYMPSRMFEGKAAGLRVASRMNENKGSYEAASLFLFQAICLDVSELVQYIIDYEGVDLPTFMKYKGRYFSKNEDAAVDVDDDDHDGEVHDDDPYNILLLWAVRSNHQKCAALFWKKGKDLLASALEMSAVLEEKMKKEENIGERRVLENHSVLFQQRALGLIDECYNNNRKKTMKLIQQQGEDNMWTERSSDNSAPSNNQILERCFDECNKKMFGTEAFRNYIERVLYGLTNPPNMDTPMEISRKKDTSRTNKFWRIFFAPVTTYSLNLISYVAFLVLLGQTLLFELEETFSPSEGILVLWWFTLVIEEWRQLRNTAAPKEKITRCQIIGNKLKGYFLGNYWNILDCVCLLFFLVGGVLMTLYHVDSTREELYQAARLFLSLDIMCFTWRLLQFLAMNSKIGPVLVMIYAMIKDVLPFLTIMFVFIVSQGLATHALLYPNRDWSPHSLIYIPKYAFWNIFGEIGLEVIQAQEPDDCSSDPLLYKNGTRAECPSTLGQYAVPFLLAMYMLLMNVLLLNIVIARFSFTFAEIHEQTKSIAAWQRACVILEYYKKPPLPPPLNVFYHLGYYIYCCCKRNCANMQEDGIRGDTLIRNFRKTALDSWERSMAEIYLASAESKSGSERISVSPSKFRSTSQTPTSDTAAHESVTEGLKELREEVNESQKEIREMKRLLREIKENTQPSSRPVSKEEKVKTQE